MAEDIERLATALKAAAAAGDEEAAKKLAEVIRVKRIEQLGAVRRLDIGTAVGAAKTVGAPVDIINAMLGAFGKGVEEPFGGSRSIQRGLANLGFTVQPGEEEHLGRAGRVGELVGTAATMGPAIVAGGLRATATQATRALASRPGVTSAIGQDIAASAVRAPGTFAASEVTLAASAGLAGFEASQKWPDSPGAQAIAEMAGGFGPIAAVPVARGVARGFVAAFDKIPGIGSAVVRGARSFFAGLTLKGGKRRAEARVRRAVEDPAVAAARLERTDVLKDAPLTGAQKIEEGNLLALEASVMESTPELSIARQRQLANTNQVIRDAMEAPVREVPTQQVKGYLQKPQERLLPLLSQNLEMAENSIQQAMFDL